MKQFCSDNIPVRLKYLKKLVEADDSCSEGLEYVKLLLSQGKSNRNIWSWKMSKEAILWAGILLTGH